MVSVHAESDRLHERARAMIHAFSAGRAMPEAFDTLAADIARFQARHVPGYRRLCAARGVAADAILQASEAPAVPTDAFKLAPVFAFDMREAAVTFRTSGTTIGARGAHAVDIAQGVRDFLLRWDFYTEEAWHFAWLMESCG